MTTTSILFTAPAAFFGVIASQPGSTSTPALRFFDVPHVTSRYEDVSDIVADNDCITTNDVPAIIVSSATLKSIDDSPTVSTPAPSSPQSSIISAFTISSATSSSPSSSARTSVTTSLRKTLSLLSLRSSSSLSSRKPSMADDMDMDFCCRGPRKKMYEDLDLDFCCRGEDVYEDEDECDDLVSLEDAVEDSIDTVAADSPAAPLTSSTAHDIIAKPVQRHRIIPDLESALPQGKSIEALVVVAPFTATLSDKPSRSSSRLSQEGTPEPAVALSSITLTPPPSLRATKHTDVASARTMRCVVDSCSTSSEMCAHFASAQPVIHNSKRSKRKVFVAWVRRLARCAA